MPFTAARTRELTSVAAGAPENFGTRTRQDTVPDRPEMTVSVVRSLVEAGDSSGRFGSVTGPTLTEGAAVVSGAVGAEGLVADVVGELMVDGSAPLPGSSSVDTQPVAPRPVSNATTSSVLVPRKGGWTPHGRLGFVMVSVSVRAQRAHGRWVRSLGLR